MNEPKPQQDPSMEEILASIRRIISEDGPPEGTDGEAAAEEAPAAEAEAAPAEPEDVEASAEGVADAEPAVDDDDVLELTEIVEDDAGGEDADQASVDSMFDALAEPEPQPEPAPAQEPAPAPAPAAAAAPAPPAGADSGLLSAAAAGAAGSQLSSLVAAVDQAYGTPIGGGNRTVEDLVKEVMRPMIKKWLDANLPSLTERIVRHEVERLARRAEGEE